MYWDGVSWKALNSIFFQRGWLGRSWCSICPYQYLELAELERTEQIRKKYNLEIVFVRPYDMKMVADWFETMPETINIFDQVRHPAATAPDLTKAYAACRPGPRCHPGP